MLKPATSWAFRTQYNVLIIDFIENENHHEYDIGPTRVLDETLRGDDRSQIIFHIDDKSWSTLDMLYDIAYQVIKFNPNHKIDWVKTFTDIELIREAKSKVDNSLNGVLEHIQYMQAISDQTREETRQRVRSKLESMGITS